MDELEKTLEFTPEGIRERVLTELTDPLILAWGKLLLCDDNETVRKTAKDIAEVMGVLIPKGAGGNHNTTPAFSASLSGDAMKTLVDGFKNLSQGIPAATPEPRNVSKPPKEDPFDIRKLPSNIVVTKGEKDELPKPPKTLDAKDPIPGSEAPEEPASKLTKEPEEPFDEGMFQDWVEADEQNTLREGSK